MSTSPGPRCARRAASGVTRVFECRYVHKDGHPVTLQWIGVWSEPERRHFFIGRDMTERKQAEEALLGKRAGGARHHRHGARRLRADGRGRHHHRSGIRQAEAMFGWPRDEAIGRPLATTIVPRGPSRASRRGARTLSAAPARPQSSASASRSKRVGRDGGEYQGRNRRHGAAPPARLRVQRLHPRPDRQDRRRRAAAPGAEDGSGRPAHRRRRARLQQHPHRHHRHDRDPGRRRRRPAAARCDRPDDRRGGDARRRADAAAARLRATPAAAAARDRRQRACCCETAKLLRPTLGEHIEIEAMLEDDAWRAVVDPAQLTTALLNLAVNARDAMPDGGKLTLETGNVMLDETYAQPNAEVRAGPLRDDRGERHRQRHAGGRPATRCSSRSSPPRRSARAPGSA